jgi:hypothetical protein
MSYNNVFLSEAPSAEQLRAAARDYEAIAQTMMSAIIDRFEVHPDYPFVDTKLDLITGRVF